MSQVDETPAVMNSAMSRFRPAAHFSPNANWINDPNGLVRIGSQFHLFYQKNPFAPQWGEISWGHAVSKDLLTWQEQGVAIEATPEEQIFSGSVIRLIDKKHGGVGGSSPLVAVYTSAYRGTSPLAGEQAQSIATSDDDGATWHGFEFNPVLRRHSANFRDPKVVRYRRGDETYWIMVAVEAEQHAVVIYRSTDLIHWTYLSTFSDERLDEGLWECPDLFEVELDDDPGRSVWVLVINVNPGGPAGGSGTRYLVGAFDGSSFEWNGTSDWLDWGPDHYAAVSFCDVQPYDRLIIGWMNNWAYAAETPTIGWNGSLTFPRTLGAFEIGGRIYLTQDPISPPDSALESTRFVGQLSKESGLTFELEPGRAVLISAEITSLFDSFVVSLSSASNDSFELNWDASIGELVVDRGGAFSVVGGTTVSNVAHIPLVGPFETTRFKLLVDRNSVEVFASHGARSASFLTYPQSEFSSVEVKMPQGTATFAIERSYLTAKIVGD